MTTESIDRPVLNGIRTALGISGVLALLLGILIIVWPGRTAMVVVAIVAVYAIAAGLVYAGLGIFSAQKGGWARVGHIVLGVLFVIAGIVAFINLPAATAWFGVFIGVLVGIMWIIEGIVSLTTLELAVSRGWTIFFAILSIVAGIVLLFAPLWGATTLWLLLGISGIVLGIVQIVRAFTFGK
ncbi:HdeD family acid-resistance protein [Microbacterium sp. NPDC058021]|uniref:HdeD family acid-resistance protein n=1 Tax=Microbacterium sp. NPDC058021 TaxID=3346306 RepID=UPI0036D77FF0